MEPAKRDLDEANVVGTPLKKTRERKGQAQEEEEQGVLIFEPKDITASVRDDTRVYLTFFVMATGKGKPSNILHLLREKSEVLRDIAGTTWLLHRSLHVDGSCCDSMSVPGADYNRVKMELKKQLETLLAEKKLCTIHVNQRPLTAADITQPLGLLPLDDTEATAARLWEASYNAVKLPRGGLLYLARSFGQAFSLVHNTGDSALVKRIAQPQITSWQRRDGINAYSFTHAGLPAQLCLEKLRKICMTQPKLKTRSSIYHGVVNGQCILLTKGTVDKIVKKSISNQKPSDKTRFAQLPFPERKARPKKQANDDEDELDLNSA